MKRLPKSVLRNCTAVSAPMLPFPILTGVHRYGSSNLR